MKPAQPIALATWMLKHLTFGPRDEALLGDLLEEFQGGRSVGWYWRQVICAIGVDISSKLRNYAQPLVFSIGWSLLYPAWWLSIVKIPSIQLVLQRWAAIDLPYSTALQGISQTIPAIAFIWLGFFIYLILHREAAHELSKLRLLGSLSMSLNVLLVTTIGLWMYLKPSGVRLSYVAHDNFSFHSHLIAISLPLALSLLSAISFARSHAQTHRHAGASIAD